MKWVVKLFSWRFRPKPNIANDMKHYEHASEEAKRQAAAREVTRKYWENRKP